MDDRVRVGFLGAGGIAKAHAYALDVLNYYYTDLPAIEKVFVASPTPESRHSFADRYGFAEAIAPEDVWEREDIEALYILGPNNTHTPQLLNASEMSNIKRIYVEKPVGTSLQDIQNLEILNDQNPKKFIMAGFQFLQKSAIRKALADWQSGVFGEPVHFRCDYLHSSYLDADYRQKHPERLQPIPINGAAADLGSHVLSLLIAFLGERLVVRSAASSGRFDNVPRNSDLCTTVLLEEPSSGAIGTMVASRVSPGTGDHLELEIRGSLGSLLFNTNHSDSYKSFLTEEGWRIHDVNSDYLPESKFPSDYVPSGWLRALVHNHYLFLGGQPGISMIPDLAHGIKVQRLLQQIAEYILADG